jgi:hypothetical protein
MPALLVLCSSLLGQSAQPTTAAFIPAQARMHFSGTREAQYWGEPSGNWRVATRPGLDPVTFLADGGMGETLSFGITVFTSDSRWEQLCRRKTLSFKVTLSADGLTPFTKVVELPTTSFSGNRYGVCWSFSCSIDLFTLHTAWLRIPASVQLSATLADADLPHPDSAAATIRLTPVARAAATFQQRMASLRSGQSKQDVISILGQPHSTAESNTGDNRSAFQRLEYLVPKKPKPFNRRWIFFNAQGGLEFTAQPMC